MMKCPVCNKSKSAFEMRPIVNVEELKVGAAMSEEKTEQEVAGTKVDVVCRDCWMTLLKNRSKEEVIEIMETICGILMEADSRMKQHRNPFELADIIEKQYPIGGTGGKIYSVPCGSPQTPPQTLPNAVPWPMPGGGGLTVWGGTGTASTPLNVTVTNDFVDWCQAIFREGDGSGCNSSSLRG